MAFGNCHVKPCSLNQWSPTEQYQKSQKKIIDTMCNVYMELDQFLKLNLKVFEFEFCPKIETSWLINLNN